LATISSIYWLEAGQGAIPIVVEKLIHLGSNSGARHGKRSAFLVRPVVSLLQSLIIIGIIIRITLLMGSG
jgi:hypothetical protein